MGKPSYRMISRANNLEYVANSLGYHINFPERYDNKFLIDISVIVSRMVDKYNKGSF